MLFARGGVCMAFTAYEITVQITRSAIYYFTSRLFRELCSVDASGVPDTRRSCTRWDEVGGRRLGSCDMVRGTLWPATITNSMEMKLAPFSIGVSIRAEGFRDVIIIVE